MVIISLFVLFVEGHETEKLGVEVKFDFADRTMTVFADDEFGDVSFFVIGFVHVIIIDAMEEHDHVSVLLDRAGVAEVGENRARVVATGDVTGKLGESDDGDFQFASELFKTTGDFGDFLDAVASFTVDIGAI